MICGLEINCIKTTYSDLLMKRDSGEHGEVTPQSARESRCERQLVAAMRPCFSEFQLRGA